MIKGQVLVEVTYCEWQYLLRVNGNGPSLLGSDWLAVLKIPLQELHTGSAKNLKSILNNHTEHFKDEVGLLMEVKTKLYIKCLL